jgi:hypothetical protein
MAAPLAGNLAEGFADSGRTPGAVVAVPGPPDCLQFLPSGEVLKPRGCTPARRPYNPASDLVLQCFP